MHFAYIITLLPLLASAVPVPLPAGNAAAEVAGLAQATIDGKAESAAQVLIASAISANAPEATILAAVNAAQEALNTAESQRAANQAAATNQAETDALNSLQQLQETQAQPLIDTLKTPAGQTAANAAELATIFANGAAFNNAAKSAASTAATATATATATTTASASATATAAATAPTTTPSGTAVQPAKSGNGSGDAYGRPGGKKSGGHGGRKAGSRPA